MGKVLAMTEWGGRGGDLPAGTVRGRDALSRALRRLDAPAALIVISPGALAGINRIYGHDVGDELIRGVSERILAATPTGALVARLAGAKIAALVPAETPEEAESLTRRLAGAAAVASGPA
ncbi:MAG: diguanylate cyclase domain-containing protein, partial [Pikeienuella sp.]